MSTKSKTKATAKAEPVYEPRSQMFAKVVLASQGTEGQRPIYTVHLRYPRIIHAEVKTHRLLNMESIIAETVDVPGDIMGLKEFNRNARSSRAVPVKTMIEEIRSTPFIPWHWGKNQKGMQAGEECDATVRLQVREYDNIQDDGTDELEREAAWLWARDKAVEAAEAFMNAGYHKQLANRLLEPFAWIDTLVTATDWANFLWLRDHKDAEPHLQDLARLVKQAIDGAEIRTLEPGQWHRPYITDDDVDYGRDVCETKEEFDVLMNKISAARCARISYKPFDGDASYERELERYDSLVKSDRVHASPLEHQATPDTLSHCKLYKVDDRGLRTEILGQGTNWSMPHLHSNLDGWIQYRKTVPGEAIRG